MDLSIPATSITVAAAVCIALVAGLLFAFAVVVMPGIRALPDREHLQAFRVMDGVIQRGSPVFLAVWAGSAVLPAIAAGVRFASDAGPDPALLVAAALVSLLAVHLPTVAVNVPLNNRLQAADVAALDAAATAVLRQGFEGRWTRGNAARTVASTVVLLLLLRALVL